ncbi:MAG: 2-hydroxyacyl-CoA dehydratase family protein [Thermodesulfobacteriota bacterium]|nr:2-hydroxyacyl-CoA dehydratase family protein [Thermodesulfobacteriota bacterium]
MEAMLRLSEHLKERPLQLKKAKDGGVKIIGCTPGGYMPEELLEAAGAIPVGLIRGGDPEPVAISGAYIPRFIDTFCRSQIGYYVSGESILYKMMDLLVSAVTDANIKAIADCFDFYTDVPVYRMGIPHGKTDLGYDYYLEGLGIFKKRIEDFTGNRVENSVLKEKIELYNRMRELLEEIGDLRKQDNPPISGRDFMKLNHATFVGDSVTMVDILEDLVKELKTADGTGRKGPRIMLTGSTMADGDSKIYDLIEETGASVVIEEFAEGLRHYWQRVNPNGDLLDALADRYFRRRVPPPFFRPSRERLDFVVELAKDFKADGVIWYQLLYRDCYDLETFYFPKILQEGAGLNFLKIQSDYDAAETGPMRTRVETYIQSLNH